MNRDPRSPAAVREAGPKEPRSRGDAREGRHQARRNRADGGGEPARAFYVIVTGTIHIERDGDFIRSMTDGGFLGEIGLIEGTKHTATATCATDCELVELGAYEFGRVMATFPDVRARVEAAAARRPHEDLV